MSSHPTIIPFESSESHSKLSSIPTTGLSIPNANQNIIKDECVLSCDTPSSPYGVFVNLATFEAVGWDFVQIDSTRTGSNQYLQIRKVLRRKPEQHEDPTNGVPTKLAIGVEGGFSINASKFLSETFYSLYLSNENLLIPLNAQEKPDISVSSLQQLGCSEMMSRLIKSIMDHSSSATAKHDSSWEEEIKESQFTYTLKQIPNPPHIPPSDWKCAQCGNAKNLWMHLADGYIGCGRKLYGVADSGCLTGEEGAAVLHWEEDKEKRPLAVKLGTITPSSADVYSYAEDSMVIDSKLSEHLAHFGINIQQAEKTEKTLAEMQIDYNKNYDWSRISESDVDLQILTGKGHIGLQNFGNTCYINSSIQLLSRVLEMNQHLTSIYPNLIHCLQGNFRPAENLMVQFVKVLNGLMTDRYVQQRQEILNSMDSETRKLYLQENPNEHVSPLLFRLCSTHRHHEFSTSRQQDAEEFLRYFLEQLENSIQSNAAIQSALPGSSTFINDLFGFKVEEQLRQVGTPNVRLSSLDERILSLPLPTPTIADPDTVDGPQAKKARSEESIDSEPIGTFEDSFNQWSNGGLVECTTMEDGTRQTMSLQTTRKIQTFPPYLLVQLRRFYLGSDWTAKKIVSPVTMPEQLDLSSCRATGMSPEDQEWKDDESSSTNDSNNVNEALVAQIENMGFSRNAALRSLRALGNSVPPENCIDWIVNHMDDADINDPLPSSSTTSTQQRSLRRTAPELVELGLTPLQIEAAMISVNGDITAAIEWVFSIGVLLSEEALQEIIDSYNRRATPETTSDSSTSKLVETDGQGKYELVGIISHMGTNANCGHYVCHAREEDTDHPGQFRWVIFNDTKVAESQHPPINLGYVYLYRRIA